VVTACSASGDAAGLADHLETQHGWTREQSECVARYVVSELGGAAARTLERGDVTDLPQQLGSAYVQLIVPCLVQ